MSKARATTIQQRFGFRDNDLKKPDHDAIILWLDRNVDNFIRERFWSSEWDKEEIESIEQNAAKLVQEQLEKLKRRRDTFDLSYLRLQIAEEEKVSAIRGNLASKRYETRKKKKDELDKDIANYPSWEGLGTPPSKPLPEILEVTWEKPIMSGKYIIGFIDMEVAFSTPSLAIKKENDTLSWEISCRHHWPALFEVKTTIPSLGELIRQIRMYQEYTPGQFYIVSPDDRFKSALESQGILFYKYTGDPLDSLML